MAEEKRKEELEKSEEAQDEKIEAKEKKAEEVRQPGERRELTEREQALTSWKPKTNLGREVQAGKINLEQIFEKGMIIKEPEIADSLIPNLEYEIVFIGGSSGKGGGIRRTPTKRTARMHRSGRRFRNSSMVIVGNLNGYVGIGGGKAKETRRAIEKASQNAKINIIPVRRGCGSWECSCRTQHSIPFRTQGKCGSVVIELIPAPRGLGLAASDPVKGILRLAGVRDVWVHSKGNTGSRQNFIEAVFNALKNLNSIKTSKLEEERTGLSLGSVMHKIAVE